MDIAELAAAIIADARHDAERITGDAQVQADAIETQTQALLSQRRERMLLDAQRRRDEAIAREDARAQRDERLAALTRKRELLDDVFAQARTRLAARSNIQRVAMLKRLLDRAKRSLGDDIGTICAAKRDAALLRSLGARVTSTQEDIGGFTARSKDGKVSIDLRFSSLLAEVRANESATVAQLLFDRSDSDADATTKRSKVRKSAAVKRRSR